MPTEREQLNVMSNTELVAYWNILQTPGIKVDDGKTERHIPIVSELLTERNIPHEKGKRTVHPIDQAYNGCLGCQNGWPHEEGIHTPENKPMYTCLNTTIRP